MWKLASLIGCTVDILYTESGQIVGKLKIKKNYSLNFDEFESVIYLFKYDEVTLRILL